MFRVRRCEYLENVRFEKKRQSCDLCCTRREKSGSLEQKVFVWPLWTFASCRLTAPAAHESRLLYQTAVVGATSGVPRLTLERLK